MSHFSVLVVSDEFPSSEVLTKLLQPYHEFECTGIDDQYVQDIDITHEAKEDYEKGTQRKLRDSEGGLHCPYEETYYRDPTEEEAKLIGFGSGWGNGIAWQSKDWGDGKGYRAKVQYIPDDLEEVELPNSECVSFDDWLKGYYGYITHDTNDLDKAEGVKWTESDKYGYALTDGEAYRVIKRTNPNKKWDYWRVGGRYTGLLQAKNWLEAVQSEPSYEWKYEKDFPVGKDVCQVCNLDFDAMKQKSIKKRQKWADECCEKAAVNIGDLNIALLQNCTASKEWQALEDKPQGEDYYHWLRQNGYGLLAIVEKNNWEIPDVKLGQSIYEWIADAPALSTFAVLKDGVWYERGQMGWWAVVHNEDDEWDSKFDELIKSLKPEQWLTVVDCHV